MRYAILATTFLAAVGVAIGLADARSSATQPTTSSSVDTVTVDLGNAISLKLARVPTGKFLMGSTPAEQNLFKDGFKDESPQHEVTISKSFGIGVYLITQEQYQQVMGNNPSKFKAPLNPVENVSWNDAVEFCGKLSAKTGKVFRLPTEAEWEYACRAGSPTAYGNGDTIEDLKKVAWCSYDGKWGSAKAPKPVGSLAPNAWGLYYMHGEMWEYCSDWYAPDAYANAKPVDPHGPDAGTQHVVRGGPWNDFPRDCRSAKREKRPPEKKSFSSGFRVLLEG
jgi:formylglycine-generating enzyme required for sulfatase activity